MKTSKKEERMLILNMVNEGKINVDESIKLLEALSSGEAVECDCTGRDFEDRLNSFSANVENLAKDFTEKAKTTYMDLEPKLKQATRTVVEKTVSILDDIARSLNESLKNMEEIQEEIQCECHECTEGTSCCEQQEIQEGPSQENLTEENPPHTGVENE